MNAGSTGQREAPNAGGLKAVVPIARTLAHESLKLTLVALEVYAQGFILISWLTGAGNGSVFPSLTLTASDDTGALYRCRPSQGYGQAVGGAWEWRREYVLTPGATRNARTLHLRIPEVRWNRPNMGARRPARVLDHTDLTPWSVDVALSRA